MLYFVVIFLENRGLAFKPRYPVIFAELSSVVLCLSAILYLCSTAAWYRYFMHGLMYRSVRVALKSLNRNGLITSIYSLSLDKEEMSSNVRPSAISPCSID